MQDFQVFYMVSSTTGVAAGFLYPDSFPSLDEGWKRNGVCRFPKVSKMHACPRDVANGTCERGTLAVVYEVL